MSVNLSGNIGIFGGTFDPVHTGHLEIARYVLDNSIADSVVFIPAPNPPHKQTTGVSFLHRVAMLELALGSLRNVSISLIEDEDSGPSFTVNTVRKLLRRRPGQSYSLIIGADSLVDLPGWYKASELLGMVSLIVAGRGQVDENAVSTTLDTMGLSYTRGAGGNVWVLAGGRTITYLPAIRWPVSSSAIRRQLMKGKRPDLLPESVYRYILDHNLYSGG